AAKAGRKVDDLVALALGAVAGSDRARRRHAEGTEVSAAAAGYRVCAEGLVAGLGEADVAVGFPRAVDAEIRRHDSGVADAIRRQRRIRLADADHAELALEIGIGPVDLGGAAGLGDALAVQADQDPYRDSIVEGRLAREVDADLLAH